MFSFLAVSVGIIGYVQAESASRQSLVLESNGKMMRKEAEANFDLQKGRAIEPPEHSNAAEKARERAAERGKGSDTYRPWNFTGPPRPGPPVIPPSREDIFDWAGPENCTAHESGGEWNHYLLTDTPMTYRHCSNSCRKVLECIGFDWGHSKYSAHGPEQSFCRLFTQKAVDVRRWAVHFNASHGGPWGHGLYAGKTSHLGSTIFSDNDESGQLGCHLRKNALAHDAFYRKVGDGKCTAESGDPLKHYTAKVASREECEEACNKVDECIAVDFGTGTCSMYVQKKVAAAHFHHLSVSFVEAGTFAKDTHTFDTSLESDVAKYRNCSVKREYYLANDYYIKLKGADLCQEWKHYEDSAANPDHCKAKCDEHEHCVGFDFNGKKCRYFTSEGVAALGTLKAGNGTHDLHPGDPDKLSSGEVPGLPRNEEEERERILRDRNTDHAEDDGKNGCYKKSHFQTWDSFEIVGNNRCNGGGWWNYYPLCKDNGATYVDCSKACLEKDACVGFDVGQGLCFLYTQYAVGEGSWPDVCMMNGGPYLGNIVYQNHSVQPFLFASIGYPTHNELTMEGKNESNDNLYHCYKKKIVPAKEARYFQAGQGTCSKDGYWPRYKLVPADQPFELINLTTQQACDVCRNACNIKDECVGFDCGRWPVEKEVGQMYLDETETKAHSRWGCSMFVQKPTWDWHLVEGEHAGKDPRPMEGTQKHEGTRPADPRLLIGDTGLHYDYEADDVGRNESSYCYQKNAWIPLDEYYVHYANYRCATMRHYEYWHKSLLGEDLVVPCKEKCDMWNSCVGFDVGNKNIDGLNISNSLCRLFVTHAVTGHWSGVTPMVVHAADGSNETMPFYGHSNETGGDEQLYAQSGNGLSRRPENATLHSGHCYIRTHWHANGEVLTMGDTR